MRQIYYKFYITNHETKKTLYFFDMLFHQSPSAVVLLVVFVSGSIYDVINGYQFSLLTFFLLPFCHLT